MRDIVSRDVAPQLAAAVLSNTKIEKFNDIPIKEMRADSFTTLPLLNTKIGEAGGLILAGLMRRMGSLTSLDLSSNNIGGYWDSSASKVVYTPEGPKAIADALRINKTLTEVPCPAAIPLLYTEVSEGVLLPAQLDVRFNGLGSEGQAAINEAVRGKEGFKLYM